MWHKNMPIIMRYVYKEIKNLLSVSIFLYLHRIENNVKLQ